MGAVNKLRNLVIITADDLNADSMGWMGSRVGATPNIDAFAANCHQFRNCHTVVPICQPARAALMTGRVPHRNGAAGFGPVRPEVTTMTEVMSRHGFLTAAINKIAHMMPREKFAWDVALEGSGKNPKAMRLHFEQCIKAAAEQKKAFFINANSTDPHGPFPGKNPSRSSQTEAAPVRSFTESEITVPSFLEDLPAVRREIAQYFSGVRRLDETFGEVMTALEGAGHMNDTAVLFVSDHGMSMPYAKATLYRNATWTPVLLGWPGMERATGHTHMLSYVDIMPTLLDLLGLPKPDGLDGASWVPLTEGKKQPDRDHVFTQIDAVHSGRKFPSRCVRTKVFSYIWNAWANGKTRFRIGAMHTRLSWQAMVEAAAYDSRLKSRIDHLIYRCAEEFYDQEKDPNERDNRINLPEYESEIAKMKALLLAHMEKTEDPLARQFRRVQTAAPERFFSRWRRRRAEALPRKSLKFQPPNSNS
jgi:N-sulfoglucosamine sulfohydrolase